MLDSRTFAFCLENFTDTPKNHPPSSLRCFFNEQATMKPSWLSEFALTGWFQINLLKNIYGFFCESKYICIFWMWVKTTENIRKSYHLPDLLLFFGGWRFKVKTLLQFLKVWPLCCFFWGRVWDIESFSHIIIIWNHCLFPMYIRTRPGMIRCCWCTRMALIHWVSNERNHRESSMKHVGFDQDT